MSTTTAKPIVELDGVSLLVGGRLVFRGTHWAIRQGEQWALVGPNGSGKTLFASALTGDVPVVRGELRTMRGAVVHVSFEQQRALAGETAAAARWFSLEEEEAPPVYQLLSQDSVEEHNPFEIVRRSPSEARTFARRRQHVLTLLGIASLLAQPLPSLSNGEMRKLLLARALLRQPRLLILDDPFAGLDEGFRHHLKTILEQLIRRRSVRLLLIATHLDELPRGITHLLRVDRCRVVAQGRFTPRRARELLRSPGKERAVRRSAGKKLSDPKEIVRLTDVSVRYGERVIVENINWTIHRGESWALLGPNGSGKSTLLSLIIGDNPQAYANDVRVFGRRRGDGESIWALKRRIGCVSPGTAFAFSGNGDMSRCGRLGLLRHQWLSSSAYIPAACCGPAVAGAIWVGHESESTIRVFVDRPATDCLAGTFACEIARPTGAR